MAKRINEYEADEVRIYRERGAEAGADWALYAGGDDLDSLSSAAREAAREASASIPVASLRRVYFRAFVRAASAALGV